MRVSLFVTCLVDQLWPDAGLCAARLLRHADCEVLFDESQTCCGQPAFNTGYRTHARTLARRCVEQFERLSPDAMVLPSGSCAAMFHHFGDLFPGDASWQERCTAMAARTWELATFLVDVLHVRSVPGRFGGRVTWHDSCHGLRMMHVQEQPRKLIAMVDGAELVEMEHSDHCCGFGGTFSVKYPEISVAMSDDKIDYIENTDAEEVVGGDVSCLMHILGRLQRRGSKVRAMHLAELLAGDDR